MAREFARTNLSIWQDDDWRALPSVAQHLYFVLQSHPELSYCGVTDWRPGRLAAFAADLDSRKVEAIGDCLEARYFIIRDHETEEVLVRSWIRFEGLIRHAKLSVSMAKALMSVASNDIRGVLVHELHKLREREPDAAGWSKEPVRDLLTSKPLDPRSRQVPGDPFSQGLGTGLAAVLGIGLDTGLDIGLAETATAVREPVKEPPTTATATATRQQQQAAKNRGTRIPDDWTPSPEVHQQMGTENPHVDLDRELAKFRDYWQAKAGKDATKTDWDATFRNWVRRAAENTPSKVTRINGQQPEEDQARKERMAKMGFGDA